MGISQNHARAYWVWAHNGYEIFKKHLKSSHDQDSGLTFIFKYFMTFAWYGHLKNTSLPL